MRIAPLLAVVPARGGSKGLPGKNIRPLAGMPLIGHSIAMAKLCPEIHRCIVSTDSSEIREIALGLGADVPFLRPAHLALDDTPMLPVLRHALEEVEKLDGVSYAGLILLDPTSFGRLPSDLAEALTRLEMNSEAVGVIACSRPTFNPYWVGVVENDGILTAAFADESLVSRRQDARSFFRINGSLYVWRTSFLKVASDSGWLGQGSHLMLEIPEARAFSIDELNEFEVANCLVSAGLIRLPWLPS